MYKHWYNYAKLKYETVPTYATLIRNHSAHKIEDVYADLERNLETNFDQQNHEADRPVTIGKNKKVFGGRMNSFLR